jgi:hypothetical protein
MQFRPATRPSIPRAVRAASIIALGAFVGCARRTAPPADTASLVIDQQPVAVALRELAIAAAMPIVVSPSAADVAACVRISVFAAQPVPRAQLSRLVLRALESTPLEVQASAGGWLVQRRANAPLPESCSALTLREGELAARLQRQRERVTADSADGGLGAATTQPSVAAAEGIRATGPDSFAITRAARDALFRDSTSLLAQVRLMPRVEQGVTRGFTLYGIRRSSVFAALGLQNGDTLVSARDRGRAGLASDGVSALRALTIRARRAARTLASGRARGRSRDRLQARRASCDPRPRW